MRICLVGTPNVGKSTLFNTLTGLRQHTVNAPGTTVLLEEGKLNEHDLIDLPGFYSFATISPDEEVAANAFFDEKSRLDLVIMVMDGAHLTKSLYLYSQVKQFNIPIIVVCTFSDILNKRKSVLNIDKFKKIIQNENIIQIDARDNKSKEIVLNKIDEIDKEIYKETKISSNAVNLERETTIEDCEFSLERLHKNAIDNADENFAWVAKVERELGINHSPKNTFSDILDSILLNSFSGPFIFLGLMFVCFLTVTTFSNPFIDLINGPFHDLFANSISDETVLGSLFLHGILDGIITVIGFLPPLFFMFIYIALMESSGILARIAVVSDRLMRMIGLDGRSLIPLVIGYGCNLPAITASRIIPDSRMRRLTNLLIPFTLCSARLAVFTVIVMALFPNNAAIVLFLLYLASITIIILLGLILKPFIVKDDCKYPFIISLPPYQLPLFRHFGSIVLVKLRQFIMEAGGIIIIITLVVWLLQSIPMPGAVNYITADKNETSTSENIDNGNGGLYKIEDLDSTDAASDEATLEDATFANVDDIHQSAFGFISDGITPIFTPLGFGNWHFSAALVSGFVAKEAFVGTLEQVYNIKQDDEADVTPYTLDNQKTTTDVFNEASQNTEDNTTTSSLRSQIHHDIATISNNHGLPASISLLLFILLYTPCMATVVLTAREFNVIFALKSLAISLTTAYVISLLVFQIGSLF